MNPILRISFFIGIACYFLLIIYFLRKKALNLKYSLLWIIAGLLMLIVIIIPNLIYSISQILGFASPVNTVFVIILFFMIVILMSLTSIVSKQNERNRRLTQITALLEKRVRELELGQNIYNSSIDKGE